MARKTEEEEEEEEEAVVDYCPLDHLVCIYHDSRRPS